MSIVQMIGPMIVVHCPDDVHLCIAYSGWKSSSGCMQGMQEWWDGLAWIASLRRWIAPYAASFNCSTSTMRLRITVGNKCGVVLIEGCCWVSRKVTSNNGTAEGGGGEYHIYHQVDHQLYVGQLRETYIYLIVTQHTIPDFTITKISYKIPQTIP